ncbi:MAG: hypothetical protein V4556_07640 [Bacteroidota bacterium]
MNWTELKALNNLFKQREIKLNQTLLSSYEINYLINSLKALDKSHSKLIALDAFNKIYEAKYLEKFESYEAFLIENDLLKSQTRFDENDIQTLIFIAQYKEELSKNLSTIRTFSSEIFKGHGSKYLENKPGLKRSVCKVLGITDFPDKDPKNLQWRLVVDCLNPKVIILCENLAHLKNPWKAREANIELWYVGGNNIGIIDFISSEKLLIPVYYSCDWDFHGLSIYSRIKAKLLLKATEIKILKPYDMLLAIPVHSDYHNSEWNLNTFLSGLPKDDFNYSEQSIIKNLIIENKWIEEESMSFEQLIRYNNL